MCKTYGLVHSDLIFTDIHIFMHFHSHTKSVNIFFIFSHLIYLLSPSPPKHSNIYTQTEQRWSRSRKDFNSSLSLRVGVGGSYFGCTGITGTELKISNRGTAMVPCVQMIWAVEKRGWTLRGQRSSKWSYTWHAFIRQSSK